jgi:hypothetical protein
MTEILSINTMTNTLEEYPSIEEIFDRSPIKIILCEEGGIHVHTKDGWEIKWEHMDEDLMNTLYRCFRVKNLGLDESSASTRDS